MEYDYVETGYLYNLWGGTLREYEGEVRRYKGKEFTLFVVKNQQGHEIKTLSCSNEDGVLYNRSVWLKNSDRRKAAKILISYEEDQIARLEFTIENHKKIIQLLTKETES